MWIFIGRNGGFYKFNANCPDSEKVGSGPGSCGGKKLTLEQMLGKAKIPTKERIVSSEFKQQTTVENTINEAAKHGIKVSLTYDANCDEISSVNNILNNTIWYRDNFPELNINTVASETNNPSPRPISKAIGDLIMKHAKKH